MFERVLRDKEVGIREAFLKQEAEAEAKLDAEYSKLGMRRHRDKKKESEDKSELFDAAQGRQMLVKDLLK